jgi:hypothetical protein
VGVQIADFLAGALFQKDVRGNSEFYDLWKPVLRKSSTGKIPGYARSD